MSCKKKQNDLLPCSEHYLKEGVSCDEKKCRYWIDWPAEQNCSLISIYLNGKMTLSEVGKRLGLSLVRIKQIETEALKKIQKKKTF